MRAGVGVSLAILLLAAASAAADGLDLLQEPFREAARRSAPSIVRVAPLRTNQERTIASTPIGTRGMLRTPAPSGVALAEEWVLTTAPNSSESLVSVATADGKLLRGRIHERLKNPPVALVHVPGGKLTPLPVADFVDACVGSWVLLLGNSFGTASVGQPPVTLGLLSGYRRSVDGQRRLVVSAAVNPGDAGGALVDLRGRLIGIASGRRAAGDQAEVLPIDDVLERFAGTEGLEPRRVAKSGEETPAEVLSRHLCRLASDLRPGVVSLVVRRTAAAESSSGSPIRSGTSLYDRFPVLDGAVTGFLVDDAGTIVTAYVNLADAEGRLRDDDGKSLLASVEAVLADGRVLPATLIGAHEGKGVAVLRIRAEGLSPAPLGTGRSLGIGRWLLTLGDPSGKENAAAPLLGFGIVSDRRVIPERYDAMLTDAPVNAANVGGPVVDMRGRIVGMASVDVSPIGGRLQYGFNSGIGFVIPIEDVIGLLPELAAEGIIRFRPGYLGVQLPVPEPPGDGVRIDAVVPDTGAQEAGLRPGDEIHAVNGSPVPDGLSLRTVLFTLAPGTTVVLTIHRGEEVLTIEVVLGLRPEYRR